MNRKSSSLIFVTAVVLIAQCADCLAQEVYERASYGDADEKTIQAILKKDHGLAETYQRLNKVADAEAEFKIYLNMAKQSPRLFEVTQAYRDLARFYDETKQSAKAIEVHRKILQLDKARGRDWTNAYSLQQLIFHYSKFGNFKTAAQYCWQLIVLQKILEGPNCLAVLHLEEQYATLLQKSHQYKLAREAQARVRKMNAGVITM